MAESEIRWVDVSPEFGSAMPNGSCNAYSEEYDTVCGYPRRPDGTCIAGHPAAPLFREGTNE